MRSQDVLWYSPRLDSMEHFRYREEDQGHRLEGIVVLSRDQTPTTIHYEVVVDAVWGLICANVLCTDLDGETDIGVKTEGERWWVNGRERTDLAGCTDIDLGWTPATNTLPIRRTRLHVGETSKVAAVWVTFPELAVRRMEQTYSRKSASVWTYSSANFTADLVMDTNGIVVTYGPDVWSTLASQEAGT
jgi:hypothetical protein